MSTAALAAPPDVRTHPIGLVPAVLVCGAAVLLFGFMLTLAGYAVLAVGLAAAWLTDRSGRTSRLLPDLSLIALGQVIISTISVEADISYGNMVLMGTVLGLAVVVPFVISRFVFRDRVIRFPWRTGLAVDVAARGPTWCSWSSSAGRSCRSTSSPRASTRTGPR